MVSVLALPRQDPSVTPLPQSSGEIEVFVDGQSVILATGLVIRTEEGPDGRVQGLHLQTFFGGTHTPYFIDCSLLDGSGRKLPGLGITEATASMVREHIGSDSRAQSAAR